MGNLTPYFVSLQIRMLLFCIMVDMYQLKYTQCMFYCRGELSWMKHTVPFSLWWPMDNCCAASVASKAAVQTCSTGKILIRLTTLDHNALHACNHNALQHFTMIHSAQEYFRIWKKPLIHNFIVSRNGILEKLTKHFGCKSTAITICW